MRSISQGLADHLSQNNGFNLADLITVRLGGPGGTTVYRWTTADTDIIYDGNTYAANGPVIERKGTRITSALDVDTWDVIFKTDGSHTNVLARSQEFDNAAWTKVVTVSPNTATAPDGSLTADKLVQRPAAHGTTIHYVFQSFAAVAGTRYTFSVYAKKADVPKVYLAFAGNPAFQSPNQIVGYNLDTGTASLDTGTPTYGIEAKGDGWFRIWISAVAQATGTANAHIQISNAAGARIYTGDGASGNLVWGAQVETGSAATEYTPTTVGATVGGLVRNAVNGVFDGAYVTLHRVFMPTWGDTSFGAVMLFAGNVAGVEPSSTRVRLTVKSELERLARKRPFVIQTNCPYALYSAGCGLTPPASNPAYTVQSATTDALTLTAASGAVTGDWVVFTTGALAGVRRAVVVPAGGNGSVLNLSPSVKTAPSPGDTVEHVKACDGTRATCLNRFNNLVRFHGFADVPRPETVK